MPVHIGFFGTSSTPNSSEAEYKAFIDTGAGMNCIDSLVAEFLYLPVIDQEPIAGVHGQEMLNIYLGRISVPSLGVTQSGQFIGVHLTAGGKGYSVLLGRTFLRHMKMTYDGKSGSAMREARDLLEFGISASGGWTANLRRTFGMRRNPVLFWAGRGVPPLRRQMSFPWLAGKASPRGGADDGRSG